MSEEWWEQRQADFPQDIFVYSYSSQAAMPEGADQPMERYKQLLQLGLIPKAQSVIPAAVAKFRKDELIKGSRDQGRQNALLDLLVFLSESRDRATLFKLLSEGGIWCKLTQWGVSLTWATERGHTPQPARRHKNEITQAYHLVKANANLNYSTLQ